MFQVFENDIPAQWPDYPMVHPSWKNSKFETFDEALTYARNWLGPMYNGEIINQSAVLELNKPHHYAGTEDYIIIKEV